MAQIPTFRAVRRKDGAVVTIDHRIWDADKYTLYGSQTKHRKGKRLSSAPLDQGEPMEFNGRIG